MTDARERGRRAGSQQAGRLPATADRDAPSRGTAPSSRGAPASPPPSPPAPVRVGRVGGALPLPGELPARPQQIEESMMTTSDEHSLERASGDVNLLAHAPAPMLTSMPVRRRTGAGMVLWFLVSLGFLLAPVLLPLLAVALPGSSAAILLGLGVVSIVLWAAVLVVTRLYVKPKANEAFVITGAGTGRKRGESETGARVVLDGGAIYIPVLHELIQVPLETIKVVIERRGKQSVITQDYLRAEITAEFYLRVKPDRSSIINAARSLGHRLNDYNALVQFVNSKVDSALRDIAANQTLDALNA
ncbi:MAG: hypothetical protein FJ125_14290, partial [Deltaproteobacteria bacterium]|nr:hypothetical protein [Deltaproteobacteria bacterium]